MPRIGGGSVELDVLVVRTHYSFPVQYLTAGVFLALVLAARRRWITGAIAPLLVMSNAAPIIPYLASQPAADVGSSDIIRVMALNLRHRFGNVKAARRLVRARRPDVVLLTEFLPAQQVLF